MLVYTDLISGDQVLSDKFPWKALDYEGETLEGIMYVQSKQVFNASEDEKYNDVADENAGFGYQGPLDIRTSEFIALYKVWSRAVQEKLESSEVRPGPFLKSTKVFMDFLKREFKNFELYAPKSSNKKTFIVGWWDDEAKSRGAPKFIYFKYALKEEKH